LKVAGLCLCNDDKRGIAASATVTIEDASAEIVNALSA